MSQAAAGSHHDHDHGPATGLISVEEARERILSAIQPLAPIELPLQEASGCVVATGTVAEGHLPEFSSSAMDGYAARSHDVAGASEDEPVTLRVVGLARIGRRPDATVGGGEAVRIDTGAPVPAGADCVVPIEYTEAAGDRVRVRQPFAEGRNVRPAGEDVRAGDVLVPAGRRLTGAELGLLALSGHPQVAAHPRPRVIVLSTGDELVEPWQQAEFGQVRDANAFTIFGGLRDAGAVPYLAGIVRDDPEALKETILSHLVQADAYISSGGVSVGERDVVKRAFFRRGEVDFFRVAMQPGMPQAFGMIEGKPYFGLPGNPVSVFVSFEVFVRPAIMKLMGRKDLLRPEISARLATEISGPKDRLQFARVLVKRGRDGWVAESTGGSSSNLVSTVAKANGLAMIPAGVETAPAGSEVRVLVFRSMES
ncbi:MAG TPA: gephyrin-like molybdotransferase Glp [Actinomycetota bacterium]|jgi:molybdopterin molybdotransferase